MSQAKNKEIGFFSQQHFQLLRCLMHNRFHCIKTYDLKLRLKAEIVDHFNTIILK